MGNVVYDTNNSAAALLYVFTDKNIMSMKAAVADLEEIQCDKVNLKK